MRILSTASQASTWLLFFVLATLLSFCGCGTNGDSSRTQDDFAAVSSEIPSDGRQIAPEERAEQSPAVVSGPVTVEVIRDGDQTISFELPDVKSGTTVEDVMLSLTGIDVEISGTGETAFLERIGDLQTSSTGGWVYRIDDEYATGGIGTTIVEPPTTITWSYGER